MLNIVIDTPAKKIVAAVMAVLIAVSVFLGASRVLGARGGAVIYNVAASRGEDDVSMGFAWFVRTGSGMDPAGADNYVQIAKKADMGDDGAFPDALAETYMAGTVVTPSGRYSNKASVTGLLPDTEYIYRMGYGRLAGAGASGQAKNAGQSGAGNRDVDKQGGDSGMNDARGKAGAPEPIDAFGPIGGFKTGVGAGAAFSFIYTSDPQTANERHGGTWKATLQMALAVEPGNAFLVNCGDQVETATDDNHYDYFFTAQEEFMRLPLMPLTGNHDRALIFDNYFNLPGNGSGVSGRSRANYWFTYGDALFLAVDAVSDLPEQAGWMRATVRDNPRNWIILAMHECMYSIGEYADDNKAKFRRAELEPVLEELGVDLVLQGHDHSYMRSYVLKNGVKQAENTEGGYSVDPDGAVYMTVGNPGGAKQYADQNSEAANAYAAAHMSGFPMFAQIDVKPDTLSIKAYKAANGELIDYYAIRKTDVQSGGGADRQADGGAAGGQSGGKGAGQTGGESAGNADGASGDGAASGADTHVGSKTDADAVAGSKTDANTDGADNRGNAKTGAAPSAYAYPTASEVRVDGRTLKFDAYNIDGFNYFKLRDLAYVFNGTQKRFSVGWDERGNAVTINTGRPYVAVGGEMQAGGSNVSAGAGGPPAQGAPGGENAVPAGAITVNRSYSLIYLDGAPVEFTAYNIGDNNYVRLRDLARALNFNAGWNEADNAVTIDTSADYRP